MSRLTDQLLTATAPVIWGSSYIVTTELLPPDVPLTVAALRALPAGLLILAITRSLPTHDWWGRLAVLGALNFAIFWGALFVAAYRLPGGVAATLGAVQPLFVLVLAHLALGSALSLRAVLAALAGMGGVALLLLGPGAGFDPVGVAAALIGAVSMGAGVVLTRKWAPPVSPLTFAGWQLIAGGLLLVPFALALEPGLPPLSASHFAGFLWLAIPGAALTYMLWFRGIARLGPSGVTNFGFLSPLSAVVLGWVLLGETLGPRQLLGAAVILASVWVASRPAPQAMAAMPSSRGMSPSR